MSKDDAAHSAEGDKLIADDGGAAMMGEVKAAGVLTVVAGDTIAPPPVVRSGGRSVAVRGK